MKVVAVFVFFALAAGSVTVAKDNTITKVVKLLQTMLDKSVKEGDVERKIYAKFKCYCDTSEEDKEASIDKGKGTIALLESEIEELQGDTGELSSECADLKQRMADNEAARDEATTLRNKENKAFKAEKKDLEQAIAQMKSAIETLTKVGADQTSATGADNKQFMAGKKMLLVQEEVTHALNAASALMNPQQQTATTAFLQGPFTGTYTSQSAVVMGIIKSMRDTFKQNRQDAIRTEADALEAYGKFMEEKRQAHSEMKDSYGEKQKGLGSNDGGLSVKREQLSDAEKQLAADEDFLKKLVPMCKDKAEAYSNRKALRASEEAAIAEAISILNSDDAFATFGTTSATSTGGSGPKFIQLRSVRKHMSGSLSVQTMAQNALLAAHSARLSKVVAMLSEPMNVRDNPFDSVLAEIEKMITLIREEGEADKKKLDWCNKERTDNDASLKKRNKEILGLNEVIDGLDKDINHVKTGLKKQIADTETTLSQNLAAQKTQSKERADDNLAYQQDVRNLVKAQSILAKAIKALKTYYDAMEEKMEGGLNAFVQTKKKDDPTPPDALADDKYSGQSGQGNAVLKMLNFILTETENEETKAHADEEAAQSDFEDSMKDLKEKQDSAENRLVGLQEDLATAEASLLKNQEDLKDTTEDRDAIEDYLVKIEPGCDFITDNFDQREKNRATEKGALDKAVGLIKGTPAYKIAVNNATMEAFGDCMAPCKKDDSHVKCLACQADVTIPAYCAGHKNAKGC